MIAWMDCQSASPRDATRGGVKLAALPRERGRESPLSGESRGAAAREGGGKAPYRSINQPTNPLTRRSGYADRGPGLDTALVIFVNTQCCTRICSVTECPEPSSPVR